MAHSIKQESKSNQDDFQLVPANKTNNSPQKTPLNLNPIMMEVRTLEQLYNDVHAADQLFNTAEYNAYVNERTRNEPMSCENQSSFTYAFTYSPEIGHALLIRDSSESLHNNDSKASCFTERDKMISFKVTEFNLLSIQRFFDNLNEVPIFNSTNDYILELRKLTPLAEHIITYNELLQRHPIIDIFNDENLTKTIRSFVHLLLNTEELLETFKEHPIINFDYCHQHLKHYVFTLIRLLKHIKEIIEDISNQEEKIYKVFLQHEKFIFIEINSTYISIKRQTLTIFNNSQHQIINEQFGKFLSDLFQADKIINDKPNELLKIAIEIASRNVIENDNFRIWRTQHLIISGYFSTLVQFLQLDFNAIFQMSQLSKNFSWKTETFTAFSNMLTITSNWTILEEILFKFSENNTINEEFIPSISFNFINIVKQIKEHINTCKIIFNYQSTNSEKIFPTFFEDLLEYTNSPVDRLSYSKKKALILHHLLKTVKSKISFLLSSTKLLADEAITRNAFTNISFNLHKPKNYHLTQLNTNGRKVVLHNTLK